MAGLARLLFSLASSHAADYARRIPGAAMYRTGPSKRLQPDWPVGAAAIQERAAAAISEITNLRPSAGEHDVTGPHRARATKTALVAGHTN